MSSSLKKLIFGIIIYTISGVAIYLFWNHTHEPGELNSAISQQMPKQITVVTEDKRENVNFEEWLASVNFAAKEKSSK